MTIGQATMFNRCLQKHTSLSDCKMFSMLAVLKLRRYLKRQQKSQFKAISEAPELFEKKYKMYCLRQIKRRFSL